MRLRNFDFIAIGRGLRAAALLPVALGAQLFVLTLVIGGLGAIAYQMIRSALL